MVLTMPPGRKYAGIVVRADGGGPVEGAELHLANSWGRRTVAATTGPGGRFHIARGPAEGEWFDLWVTAPGLAARRVEVSPKDSENMRIELSRAGRLRGRVTDADGVPVAGVELSTGDDMGPPAPACGRTDAEGRFDLAGVLPGDGWVRMTLDGYPEYAEYF